MAGDEGTTATIEDLIAAGAIVAHKDGNYGSNYPRVEEFGSEGVPFLTAKSLRDGYVDIAGAPRLADARADELAFGFVEPDDVLLSHNATIGRIAVVPPHNGRLLVGTSLTYFRLNPQKLLPRYLAVYMAGSDFQHQLVAVMSHSTRNQVPVTAQRKLYVFVPPLAEQRAIAHILGTLDDRIELNRRRSGTLEAMARAMFKSWFVDFDPVRAKVEGRDPGLPRHIADLFPARFFDSELSEIPEGWELYTLAEFCTLNPEVWTRDTRPPELNYVDLSNSKWGRIEVVTTYSQHDAPSRAQRVLRPGDTIVGTVRPGNGSYAFISEEGLTGSTGFAVLRPVLSKYAEVVYLAATAKSNIDALSHLADGGAYPAVRPEVVASTPIVFPANEERLFDRFSEVAKPVLARIAANEREGAALATLRDTLLPRLISGELRVKDAEKFIARAV